MLINNVKIVPGLKGWLLIDFDDKMQKIVNINPLMTGYLSKLGDQTFFTKVFVDKELQTISWPGELDLDPDNLYWSGIEVELFKDLVQAIKNKDEFVEFIDREIAN